MKKISAVLAALMLSSFLGVAQAREEGPKPEWCGAGSEFVSADLFELCFR
ncbi:hypothetical protein [Deinococcus sp. YIM 77859]|nr:hypothetical protein [Deinococcus sp. YIM 77859]